MKSTPAGPRLLAVWRDIPRDLSVAWLAITPLYLLSSPGLPEPMIALAVGTTVGLASSVLKAGISQEVTEQHDQLRPPPPPPNLPGRSPIQLQPGVFGVPALQRDVHHVAIEPTPPQRAVPRPLDFGKYRSADPLEAQCPHCGSFDTVRSTIGQATCHICGESWSIGASTSAPDVVVRSWLSPPTSTPE